MFNGEGFHDERTVQEIYNVPEPNYFYPSKSKYKMLKKKKENNITNCQ
jgi:hypothetical protein